MAYKQSAYMVAVKTIVDDETGKREDIETEGVICADNFNDLIAQITNGITAISLRHQVPVSNTSLMRIEYIGEVFPVEVNEDENV